MLQYQYNNNAIIKLYTYSILCGRTSQYSRIFFSSQCPCGMILHTLYSVVWNRQVSRAGSMLSYWPKQIYSFLYTIFPFLFFLSLGWYCGAMVFRLIGYRSLCLCLALPTSFNNNNNNVFVKILSYAIWETEFINIGRW